MSIKLALELPSEALTELNQLADLDFAISYRVLEDDEYRKHYSSRKVSRDLILDNGYHERGWCGDWNELKEAAAAVYADYIIIPDPSGPHDAKENLSEMRKAVGKVRPEQLALVVAGEGQERAYLVKEAMDAGIGMLCFSRMVARRQWYEELLLAVPRVRFARIHLLGMRSVKELQSWLDVPNVLSTDTSKPAKAALLGRLLNVDGNLAGMGIPSARLFEQSMTPEQRELCRQNIALLRTACGR